MDKLKISTLRLGQIIEYTDTEMGDIVMNIKPQIGFLLNGDICITDSSNNHAPLCRITLENEYARMSDEHQIKLAILVAEYAAKALNSASESSSLKANS